MQLRYGFPIVHEAEGGAAPAAAPAAPDAAPAAPATTPAAAAPAGGEPPAAPAAPAERPAWLPEGMADGETLAKSYGELRAKLSGKQDALKAEVLAAMREGVPEAPDGYELAIPEGLLPAGFVAAVPADDPFLGAMRKTFHELGAKPEQFQAAAAAFLQWQVSNMPDIAGEKMKLGEGADERLSSLDMWLSKTLDEPGYKAVMNGLVTAEGITALEKLMKLATGNGVGGVPGSGSAMMTPDEAALVLRDPDYRREGPRGNQLRAQFNDFVARGGRLSNFNR